MPTWFLVTFTESHYLTVKCCILAELGTQQFHFNVAQNAACEVEICCCRSYCTKFGWFVLVTLQLLVLQVLGWWGMTMLANSVYLNCHFYPLHSVHWLKLQITYRRFRNYQSSMSVLYYNFNLYVKFTHVGSWNWACDISLGYSVKFL